MIRFMSVREQRVKTLLARHKRLHTIQSDIALPGGDWFKGETMDRWMRAQGLRVKTQKELGVLASIYLEEVG